MEARTQLQQMFELVDPDKPIRMEPLPNKTRKRAEPMLSTPVRRASSFRRPSGGRCVFDTAMKSKR